MVQSPEYPTPKDMDHLIRILSSFTDYEKNISFHKGRVRLDLKKMVRLVRAAGDPQSRIPAIHITGSKGKGSTAIFCAAILRSQGFKTGLFTSPHLERINERIVIDGRALSDDRFLVIADQGLDLLREDRCLSPTFFEFMTLTAMLAFQASGVEAAIYEVGLGGRLDATNVVRPRVTVITSVEKEHCALLGDTEAEIAFEKAGIVKRGTPLITAISEATAGGAILVEKASRVGAPLLAPGRGLTIDGSAGEDLYIEAGGERFGPCRPPRPRALNAWNAACALAAAREWVAGAGGNWEPEKACAAVGRVSLPGRFEIVARHPWIILDGAHTPSSVRASLEEVRALTSGKIRLIFGLASDKEAGEILATLETSPAEVIYCPYDSGRSMAPAQLRELAHGKGEAVESPAEALEKALVGLSKSDLLLITGSFYLAGEMRQLLRGKGVPALSLAESERIY